jgi:formyl-CoA transferase
LGEHSREILAELGFEASEIAAMLASGSVQQHPFDKGTA